jgi:hypothetical protein
MAMRKCAYTARYQVEIDRSATGQKGIYNHNHIYYCRMDIEKELLWEGMPFRMKYKISFASAFLFNPLTFVGSQSIRQKAFPSIYFIAADFYHSPGFGIYSPSIQDSPSGLTSFFQTGTISFRRSIPYRAASKTPVSR